MSATPAMINAWRCAQGKESPLTKRLVPMPRVQPKGFLVRIKAMGVCHSDCAILATQTVPETWAEEFTLGHEGAGEVVEIGSEAKDTAIQVGDLVAIHLNPGCGDCILCHSGWSQACRAPNNGGYGLGRDGMMQEYVSVRADAVVKVPEGVRIEDACIAPDALLTAYHAVKNTAAVRPEHTIAIFGLGGLGLNALQIAQHTGVERILVCDKRQEAIDIAIRLGVPPEDTFCTADSTAAPIHEALAKRGIIVDTVLDFVGHAETVLGAQLVVRPAGLVVLVGLLSEQAPLLPVLMASNCLTIKGSYCGTVEGLKECLELVRDGVIKPEVSTASVEELPQVLKDLDEGRVNGRKVLLPSWGANQSQSSRL